MGQRQFRAAPSRFRVPREAGVDRPERAGNAGAMLRALSLALGDLSDRRLLVIWFKSMGLAVLACLALAFAAWNALTLAIESYAGRGELGQLAAALFSVLFVWLAWRVVALAVLQFFADEVVEAIEARHYPAMAASARKLGWREEAGRSLAGAGRAVIFNLLAVPLALILLVTGIGAPLVFIAVNAVLLGRELQDMVWLRHRLMPNAPAPLSKPERLALGGLTAVLLSVPFINFAAPFLGAACAVHLIHRKGPGHAP